MWEGVQGGREESMMVAAGTTRCTHTQCRNPLWPPTHRRRPRGSLHRPRAHACMHGGQHQWCSTRLRLCTSLCAYHTHTHPAPPHRLSKAGYDVGARVLELLSYREKAVKRKPEILDMLRWIHSTAWPYLFGKSADDLQQGAAVSAHACMHALMAGRQRGMRSEATVCAKCTGTSYGKLHLVPLSAPCLEAYGHPQCTVPCLPAQCVCVC